MTTKPFASCHPLQDLQSPFSMLFIDLQQRISEAVPNIHWCDQWWGQEQLSYHPAVAFPAALIDFPNTSFSAEGDGSLFATINISLRLLFAPFSSSAATAPNASRADALQCYEVEQQVIAALHNWMPDKAYCQPLVLSGIATENRNPEYRVRNLTFSTAYELDVV